MFKKLKNYFKSKNINLIEEIKDIFVGFLIVVLFAIVFVFK